jgi:hypothetical protein
MDYRTIGLLQTQRAHPLILSYLPGMQSTADARTGHPYDHPFSATIAVGASVLNVGKGFP